MKTIVWNMAQKVRNWDVLTEWPELKDADVSLLCEAGRPPHDVAAEGAWSTLGLEAALGPEKPVKRPWSTAIASPHSLDLIEDACDGVVRHLSVAASQQPAGTS